MNIDSAYDVVLSGVLLILAAAILIGLFRIYTSTAAAERAVVGDLVFFAGVGILMIVGIQSGSAVIQDAAMLAAFLGILATVALARILTRGER
ncbi:monovalent cation/H+ antiporter complex subunit F [Citricoccus nitrophenolicus]|uniref:Monovalent cation/H+ antiporter complex subunit F n=1 Tax=Citricoccus nitrophenolicus TaxID=863575 RepID=A0ABV0IG59_9MICC|nr:monovalent cation/H+ antiporter complex subunit F [Citricoccus sp. I39-566]WMY79065.1 monovalent cation/H+ antiporter complex subunit F [Citricoccus sp. I39-566]